MLWLMGYAYIYIYIRLRSTLPCLVPHALIALKAEAAAQAAQAAQAKEKAPSTDRFFSALSFCSNVFDCLFVDLL